MLPIRTILHPTDFSERSESAFLLACSLGREYGAVVIVLHVREPGAGVYQSDSERMEMFRELSNGVRTPRLLFELAEGKPAVEILRTAGESKADLIVMGTHGRTGFERLLMGSVTEQVIRRAACPVLAIKEAFPEALAAEAKTGDTQRMLVQARR